jgi:hypothetical protein
MPYFAFDFLLDHFADLYFDFLFLGLVNAFFPGVGFFNGDVAADLHFADAFFGLADADGVLVGDFFLHVFTDANLASLLFGFADGDLAGVGFFDDLALVAGVFNFGFHDVWHPYLADACN